VSHAAGVVIGESWNIAGEVCYDRCTMRGLHDIPRRELPEWEPEALHVPEPERPVPERLERPVPERVVEEDSGGWRIRSGDAGDDDLPGSHVIVIDLA
jgi:hypothetical protein